MHVDSIHLSIWSMLDWIKYVAWVDHVDSGVVLDIYATPVS